MSDGSGSWQGRISTARIETHKLDAVRKQDDHVAQGQGDACASSIGGITNDCQEGQEGVSSRDDQDMSSLTLDDKIERSSSTYVSHKLELMQVLGLHWKIAGSYEFSRQ